jgi:hypothetical protein
MIMIRHMHWHIRHGCGLSWGKLLRKRLQYWNSRHRCLFAGSSGRLIVLSFLPSMGMLLSGRHELATVLEKFRCKQKSAGPKLWGRNANLSDWSISFMSSLCVSK